MNEKLISSVLTREEISDLEDYGIEILNKYTISETLEVIKDASTEAFQEKNYLIEKLNCLNTIHNKLIKLYQKEVEERLNND